MKINNESQNKAEITKNNSRVKGKKDGISHVVFNDFLFCFIYVSSGR